MPKYKVNKLLAELHVNMQGFNMMDMYIVYQFRNTEPV